MAKYYFQNRGERCYTKEYWLQYMKDLHIPEMTVFEAKREVNSGYFYCNAFDEVGEKGEGCGKECKYYKPRNKISGICTHHSPTYEQTTKKITLKK